MIKINKKSPHISFSELTTWKYCPWKHKLAWLDRVIPRSDNSYSIFGRAAHEALEQMLIAGVDPVVFFFDKFTKDIKQLRKDGYDFSDREKQAVVEMFSRENTSKMLNAVRPELDKMWPGFEVLKTEELLEVPIFPDIDYEFKGLVDLVIKHEGKYYIIDWKTSGPGWDIKYWDPHTSYKKSKKQDTMTAYQIVLYKEFYARKYNLDRNNLEAYFILIKRKAKNPIEFLHITSGKKKTDNALALLKQAITNILGGNIIKNRLGCERCDLHKTEWCSG